MPGRIRRCAIDELPTRVYSAHHDLNLAQTYELAGVLDRAPRRVVVIGVAPPTPATVWG